MKLVGWWALREGASGLTARLTALAPSGSVGRVSGLATRIRRFVLG